MVHSPMHMQVPPNCMLYIITTPLFNSIFGARLIKTERHKHTIIIISYPETLQKLVKADGTISILVKTFE